LLSDEEEEEGEGEEVVVVVGMQRGYMLGYVPVA